MILLFVLTFWFLNVQSEKFCIFDGKIFNHNIFFVYRTHFNVSCLDGKIKVENCLTEKGTFIPLGTLSYFEDGFNYTCKDGENKGRAPRLDGRISDEWAEECEFGHSEFIREGLFLWKSLKEKGFVFSCNLFEILGCVDAFGDLVRNGLFVTANGGLRHCYVYTNKRRAHIERRGCFNGSREDDLSDNRFFVPKGKFWITKDYEFRCGDDGFQVYKCLPSAKERIHTGTAWFDRNDVLNICQLN